MAIKCICMFYSILGFKNEHNIYSYLIILLILLMLFRETKHTSRKIVNFKFSIDNKL